MEEQTQKQKISPYLWVTVTLGTLFVLSQIITICGNIFENVFAKNIENLLKEATEVTETEDSFLIDYSDTPARKYSFFDDKYFNSILEFKDKGSSVYKFVVDTDASVGNGGSSFSYEIGRIYINSQNPNKSKCTYNYMAKFSDKQINYFECSESQFIETLPKISDLKKKKFDEYKKILDEENQLDICGYGENENNPECSHLKGKNQEDEWSRLENLRTSKLAELRSVTLEK